MSNISKQEANQGNITMKDWIYFQNVRKIAFTPQSNVKVRAAGKSDLSGIINVEWACFPHLYEGRWTPGTLLYWYNEVPQMFRIAENGDGDVIGYSCLVPLTQSGYDKFIAGKHYAIVHLERQDVDSFDAPTYLSLEVISAINPGDSTTGAILVRDYIRNIPTSCKILTTTAATIFGERLMHRFGFKLIWSRHSADAGEEMRLFILDLQDPEQLVMLDKLRRHFSK